MSKWHLFGARSHLLAKVQSLWKMKLWRLRNIQAVKLELAVVPMIRDGLKCIFLKCIFQNAFFSKSNRLRILELHAHTNLKKASRILFQSMWRTRCSRIDYTSGQISSIEQTLMIYKLWIIMMTHDTLLTPFHLINSWSSMNSVFLSLKLYETHSSLLLRHNLWVINDVMIPITLLRNILYLAHSGHFFIGNLHCDIDYNKYYKNFTFILNIYLLI